MNLVDGIHQLIIDKVKILEKNVPQSIDVDYSVGDLNDIKASAIAQTETDLFFDVRYRILKEEQKRIARDPNSEEPYCFIQSNSGSDQD